MELILEQFCSGSEDLDKEWEELARTLVGEDKDNKKERVEEFKKAVFECEEFKDSNERYGVKDDAFYIRFLRAGNWDVGASLDVLQQYVGMGRDYPNYVHRAIPSLLDNVWQARVNTVLQTRDQHGRRVVLFKISAWDPDKVPVLDFFASMFVAAELIVQEVKTQVAGVTVVGDIEGFSFKHLRSFGLEQVKVLSSFFSGAFPVWFRQLHMVNHPRVFNVLYNMVKPFLSERVKNNIIFHGSDLSGLHRQVPRCLLPASLGGELGDQLDNNDFVKAVKERDAEYKDLVNQSKNIPQLELPLETS